MLSILLYLLLGFAIGTFGTLVGIGGGVILVPIFLVVAGAQFGAYLSVKTKSRLINNAIGNTVLWHYE